MPRFQDPITLPQAEEDIVGVFNLYAPIDKSFIGIIKYLVSLHGAKTAIVEERYIDKDWSNEFSNHYSKTFANRNGFCERIHFFNHEIKDLESFKNIWLSGVPGYLGYVVRRPIFVGKAGRSLIKPFPFKDFYYLCCIEREVHIFGKTQKVKGIPYIEQDAIVMSCAQSCIWMATNYMHHAHKLSRVHPYDITESTNMYSFFGRPIPSTGLTVQQMVLGLNRLGLSPLVYSKPREHDYNNKEHYEAALSYWDPTSLIYPYIESEIPVIVAFEEHTCVIVGHTMNSSFADINLNLQIKKSKNLESIIREMHEEHQETPLISSQIFCDSFIINDDQRGPYRILPADKTFQEHLAEKFPDFMPRPHFNKITSKEELEYEDIGDIDEIIIPLPDKVYLTAADASEFLRISLSPALQDLSKVEGNQALDELFGSTEWDANNPLIYRLHCVKSVIFQESIIRSPDIADKVKYYYQTIPLPRLLWVAEISTFNIYKENYHILGEIVFDATANRFDRSGALISIHLPSYFSISPHIIEMTDLDESRFPDIDIPFENYYELFNLIAEVRRPCHHQER